MGLAGFEKRYEAIAKSTPRQTGSQAAIDEVSTINTVCARPDTDETTTKIAKETKGWTPQPSSRREWWVMQI